MIVLSCGKWQMKRRSGLTSSSECTPRFHSAFGSSPSRSDGHVAHPRHDAHAQHDVDRVGDFEPDLGQRRIRRSHDVGHDEHRPPAHRAFQHAVQLAVRLGGLRPVVGRAGFFLRRRADEGELLDRATSFGFERCR